MKKSEKAVLLLTTVVACLLSGCIFAPRQYGSRAIVTPESEQYKRYLENCRGMSSQLDEACKMWGNPGAIKIGHSGGYFAWHDPYVLYSVGSFGRTKVTSRIPKDMWPFLGINANNQAVVKRKAVIADPESTRVASYEIDKFERESGDDFAYSFELTAKNPLNFAEAEKIKKELRESILDEYRMAYGTKSGVSIQADFPEYSIAKDRIVGKAVVMQLSVQSLVYNAERSTGVIRVKMGTYSFEDVRRIVRRNIENIVRDKNIALSTGEIPPETRFTIGNERVTGDGIMEIEFEAL